MGEPATVAVVGGGASGCLAAMQIARAAAGRQIEILIIEPAELGAGLAFSTPDPWHRLNVAARAMSALPGQPEHFLSWLQQQVDAEFPAGGFAPRCWYAEYLRQTLAGAVDAAGTVSLEQVRARVTDLGPAGRRLRLTLDDGARRAADAVVLALGHGAPATSWAPETLRRSARFVADPWRTDRVPQLPAGSNLLLVGAGLTMADLARRWAGDGVRLHVVSRHGMLPLPHAAVPQPPVAPPSLPSGAAITLAQARHLVFEQLRSCGGDWRPVIDGMRPVTAALWSRLSEDARARFLATAARRWDRVRHRVDPELHSWLTDQVAAGSLVSHAAAVTAVREDRSALHIQLDNGTCLTVAAVLNCTGSGSNADPLLLNLLDAGVAQAGPVGLGLATDPHGRLLPATGVPPAVWTLGPLRRGELWESIAIPEIRQQAVELARGLVAGLPPKTRPDSPLPATEGAAELLGSGLSG